MKVSIYANAALFSEKKQAAVIAILSDKIKKTKKLVFDQLKTSNKDTALCGAILKALKELKKPHKTEVEINLPKKVSLLHPKLKKHLKRLKSYTIKLNPHTQSLEKLARVKFALMGIIDTRCLHLCKPDTGQRKKQNLPAKKIKSYSSSLEEKGFFVEVNLLEDNPEYAEAEIDIYDRNQKLISAQTVTADTNSYYITCHRCPLPSRCPFYGRYFCHESTLH